MRVSDLEEAQNLGVSELARFRETGDPDSLVTNAFPLWILKQCIEQRVSSAVLFSRRSDGILQ